MNRAHEMLVAYLTAHPDESFSSVARLLNTSPSTITRIAQRAGLPPRSAKRITMADVGRLHEKAANTAEANDDKEANYASNG